MQLVSFPAGTYIELDDPTTSNRCVVQVAESGTEFIDYISKEYPATPLPIYAEMNPIDLGDFRTLKHHIYETRQADWQGFSDFITDVLEQLPDYDDLKFMRVVKWAFDGGEYQGEQGLSNALAVAAVLTAEAIKRHTLIARMSDDMLTSATV